MVALVLAVFAFPCIAQQEVRIRASTGHPDEKLAVLQLRKLLGEYPVERWIFTRDVLIEKGVIPHSHPVLTLNAAYLDDDRAQLATFLHEEFHWYLESEDEQTDRAIAAFEEVFPEAPFGRGIGARDRRSTYLHLIVCDLEFQAMVQSVGEKKAREVLGSFRHYTWIYGQVLENPQVRRINRKFGFVLPLSGRPAPGNGAGR